MKKTLLVFTSIILLTGLVLTANGEEAAAASSSVSSPSGLKPQYGGTWIDGQRSSSAIFGYVPKIAYAARRAAQPALEPLFDFDREGNPRVRLAKGWEVSPDGKSFTIFLREGVKFHDGTDCNAEAVKWNMEQFAVEKVVAFATVNSIDVIDDYTLRLNLDRFSNTIYYDLALSPGMVMSPTAFAKHGKEWTYTHPVGTGPMKFVSFERDVSLKYERFDDYWDKGKPYLDRIEYHYISDPVTQEMALRSGDIDVLSRPALKSIASLKEAGFRVNTEISGVFGLFPDSANPGSKFADKRVREALEYAIDKDAIVSSLGYGYMDTVNQVAHRSRPSAYCPDIKGRKYNPEKAKQLLADAGYPNGFKTTIHAPIWTSKDELGAIQAYLSAVGIDATIDICDPGRWSEVYYKGWNNSLVYYFTPSEPNGLFAIYKQFHPDSYYAASIMKPAALREILDKADAATDTAEMYDYVKDAVRFISKEAICAPILAQYHVAIENPKCHDSGNFDGSVFKTYWAPENAWKEK